MTQSWLAFDIGTTGTKAAVVDGSGRILRSAIREYPTHTAEGGIVEQRTADWWAAVAAACRSLEVEGEIEAIALTGQMQDVILLNADGEPVRPVILYSDTRARAEAEQVVERLSAERLRALTGNDQDAGSLLAKLLWLQIHEQAAVDASAHLLPGAADYAAFKMTGIAATDTTTTSTTGLMDLATRAPLDSSIFEAIGIGNTARLIPSMHPGGAQIGTLTAEAAKALGLRPGIPVHHGPGDAGAATLGAGSGEIGTAYAYLGTSGWVAFTAPDRARPGQGVITLAHPHPERFIQVAPLLTAGGNLAWVRDLFGAEDYVHVIGEALDRPPSSLLYLPYLNGERSPFSDPLARGAFVGINAASNRADFYRAVLEGVVYAYRHALDALMPQKARTLVLTGGGTRSERWSQLFADILDTPVTVLADAEHVGVRGAVLAAQVLRGERPSYTPPGYFPVEAEFQPDGRYREHFDRQYRVFRDAYPALKPIFARLAPTPDE